MSLSFSRICAALIALTLSFDAFQAQAEMHDEPQFQLYKILKSFGYATPPSRFARVVKNLVTLDPARALRYLHACKNRIPATDQNRYALIKIYLQAAKIVKLSDLTLDRKLSISKSIETEIYHIQPYHPY